MVWMKHPVLPPVPSEARSAMISWPKSFPRQAQVVPAACFARRRAWPLCPGNCKPQNHGTALNLHPSVAGLALVRDLARMGARGFLKGFFFFLIFLLQF